MKKMNGMAKRFLSLFLAAAMVLSVMPGGALTAYAEEAENGLCAHHTEHTEQCGYTEGMEEVPCDKDCTDTDGDGVTDHAEDCAYTPAVEGHPCDYVCNICPVQELIDVLPEAGNITADNEEEVKAQLLAIDEALAALTEEERSQADIGRYTAAADALAALTKEPDNTGADTQMDLTKENNNAAAGVQTDLTKENNNTAANAQTDLNQENGPEKTGGIQNYTVGDPESGISKTNAGTNAVDDISLSPERLDFGTWEVSEERPAAQTVTLTNTGSQNVEVSLGGDITSYYITPGEGFDEKGQITLAPNATAQFSVQPKEGLKPGTVGTGMYFQCQYPGEQYGRLKQLLFSLDVVCTKHGYGEWTTDDKTHSRVCQYCGAEEKGDHTFEDGRCTVCGARAVVGVKIGTETTYYENMEDAWNAAKGKADGATVILFSNVSTDGEGLTVADGDNITLDSEPGDSVCTLNLGNGELTVTGGSFTLANVDLQSDNSCIAVQGGSVSIEGGSVSGYNGMHVTGGSLEVSGGTVSGKYWGSGISIVNGAVRILDGASIKDGNYGIMVSTDCTEGSLAVLGGKIAAQSVALCIQSSGCDVTLSGGTFTVDYRNEIISCIGADRSVGSLLAGGYAYKRDGAWVNDASESYFEATSESKTVTVEKVPVQGVTVTADKTSLTYGDAAPTLTATVAQPEGITGEITYQWYQDGAEITGATSATYTPGRLDAGDYTYTCMATAEDYACTSTAVAVKVERKAVAAVVTAQNKTYDGNTNTVVKAEVTEGLVNGDSITITGLKGTFEDANAGTNKEVRINSEDIFINGTNKNNYMVSIPTTTTATISSMSVPDPVIMLESDSYEYDGTEKKPDVKVFDEETEIDAREYVVSYSDNVETGTATVTITDAKGGNYEVSGSTTFQITRRPVSVTPDSLTKEYGTSDPELTYEITSGSLVEGHTLTLSRVSGEDIGNYAINQYRIVNQDDKDVSGNYDVILEKVDFQITRPDLSTATVTLDQDSFLYDGTAREPEVTVVKNGNTLVKGMDYTVTYESNVDAGTATVTVTAVEDGNYDGFQTVEFKINPMDILNAEVDLGADPAYNGQEQTKTIRLTLGKRLEEGTDYQVSGNTGTNVGSYTLTVTGQGNYTGTIEREWEVMPCKLWAYAWDLSKIYDGTTAVTLTAGDAILRAGNYGIVDGDEVLLDTTGVTARFASADAGSGIAISYTGTFALTGKDADNYVLAEQPDGITGTITRRQITVTPDAGQRVEYSQAVPELTYTIGGDGMAKGESLTGALSCDIGDGAVGEYAITRGSLAAGENYDLSFTDGVMFEITKPDLATADVTLTLPDDGYTYDGAEKTPGITVVKDGKIVAPSEYTASYINSNGGEGDHTNAGVVTVTAGIDNGNYHLTGPVTADFVVARADAELSVSPDKADKIYGDAVFALTPSYNGDGEVAYESDNTKVATVEENGIVTLHNAGKAAITVTLAETANYEGDEISVAIQVDKAGDRLTVEKLTYEVTYGDADFIIALTTDSGSTVTFTSSDTSVATVDETGKVQIVGAGEAEITMETAESENYSAVSKIVTVTVKPKEITVTADDKTKVYGEDDPELTYTATGLVADDTLEGITLTRAAGDSAGSYEIVAFQEEGVNPNYSIRFVNGVLTIQPKDITGAAVKLGAALIENGEPQTQKIQSVTLQNSKGEEVDVTYEVSGNTGKDWGSYTMTVIGTGNFTGSITRTFVIAPAANSLVKPSPDGKVEIGRGAIDAWVHHETGAPAVTLRTGEPEIIEMLTAGGHLTAEELAQVADGADMDIILRVADASDTISATSRAQIEKTASGCVIGRYLDISLYKQITVAGQTGELVPITGFSGDITISVEIPKELLNTDKAVTRTFWIIRNHDGVTDFLATTYDEAANALTFTTDRFSDYAIVYQDARRAADDDDDDAVASDAGSGGPAPLNTALGTVPPTGDDANPWLWILLLLLACSGMAAAVFRGKRKKARDDS